MPRLLIAGTSGGHDVNPGAPTVPDPPTAVAAIAGNASAAVSWTAPLNNGGSSITGYEVTPYIGASAQSPILTGSSSPSFNVTGLTNGTTYTFAVATLNGVGLSSFSSVSNSVTPAPPVSVVQSARGTESETVSNPVGFPAPTSNENSLLVVVQLYSPDGPTFEIDMAATNPVVDGVNTFVQIADAKQAGTIWYQHVYYYLATDITGQNTPQAGAVYNTITTTAQRAAYQFTTIYELTPAEFDRATVNIGTGTLAVNAGTLTPPANGAMGFLAVTYEGADANNFVPNVGWLTDRNEAAGGGTTYVGHFPQTTAAPINFTITGPNGGNMIWTAAGIDLIPG